LEPNIPPKPVQEDAATRLGTEPVGTLLLRFSLPAVIGMLVNALYNIVDRIFVGRGVGEIALGGLSLVLPIMTIGMALAMLFGIGAANLISMRLGEKRHEDAESALNHCFVLLFLIGVLMTTFGLIFLDPLLSLMGAAEGSEALVYAKNYCRIILYGSMFGQVGFGLSHCTRAQGFPKVTMYAMLTGAILNTLLDPVFIFWLGWGVEGAAWATALSQFVTAVLMLWFGFSKKAVLRLHPLSFRPSLHMIGQIISFGMAQYLLQLVMSGVQLVYNRSMSIYGPATLGVANGGDIALAGNNIVGSVLMLVLMPVFGINQGAQPVLGYNYGAKQFGRVLSAFRRAILSATCICLFGFLCMQIFPEQLVRMFAPDGSAEILGFAPRAMRIISLLLPLNGFQIVASNMFVVTGRPKTSIFLSLLRQLIFLVPLILLFGWIWGLYGVITASPVADGLSVVVTGIATIFELKKLSAASKLESAAEPA
jgi:putative MATE family efflux protein